MPYHRDNLVRTGDGYRRLRRHSGRFDLVIPIHDRILWLVGEGRAWGGSTLRCACCAAESLIVRRGPERLYATLGSCMKFRAASVRHGLEIE